MGGPALCYSMVRGSKILLGRYFLLVLFIQLVAAFCVQAQKQAKKAIGFLKVIAEGLPSATKLAELCKELLPTISHLLGL